MEFLKLMFDFVSFQWKYACAEVTNALFQILKSKIILNSRYYLLEFRNSSMDSVKVL